MQTFLPYPSFWQSARCLDRQRLGKQRVEAKQILNALAGRSRGWVDHPATRMWRGYEGSLAIYGGICCTIWVARGYRDNTLEWFREQFEQFPSQQPPPWLGREDFHRSHKSNLLRKDPEWYGDFNWDVPDDLPYVWPV